LTSSGASINGSIEVSEGKKIGWVVSTGFRFSDATDGLTGASGEVVAGGFAVVVVVLATLLVVVVGIVVVVVVIVVLVVLSCTEVVVVAKVV
jgi:hypothetical protein